MDLYLFTSMAAGKITSGTFQMFSQTNFGAKRAKTEFFQP